METEVYRIYYDREIQVVIMEWNGYATSIQFRNGTELMLETLTSHNASKVLADIREMSLIGQEDQHWLENNFLPRAIAAGFSKLAIVKPLSYFNKVAVDNIFEKVDPDKLLIQFFDSRNEAVQWLI